MCDCAQVPFGDFGSCAWGFVDHGLVDRHGQHIGSRWFVFRLRDSWSVEVLNARSFRRGGPSWTFHRKPRHPDTEVPTLDEAYRLIARKAGAAWRRNRRRYGAA